VAHLRGMTDKKKVVFSGVAGMDSGKWCSCPGYKILKDRKGGKKCTFEIKKLIF
jgi:hypothetical protein